MRALILAVFAAVCCLPTANLAQRGGPDLLSTGVVVRGTTEFKRETRANGAQPPVETMIFAVRSESESIDIRLMAKYALDRAYVSSSLYRMMIPGGSFTIRFADRSNVPEGTIVPPSATDGIVGCLTHLEDRDARRAVYVLRCVNVGKAAENDKGQVFYEVDIFVFTPNRSTLDEFLLRHDRGNVSPDSAPGVYVRVEK